MYDSLGREVDTLVDGFQNGGQWYNVLFGSRTLSSGTYFVRLEVLGVGNNKSLRTGTMTVVN